MEEEQMTELQSKQAGTKKETNAWKCFLLIVLGSFCFVTIFSKMHQGICKGQSKESQIHLTKEDTEGLGWLLASSYGESLGLNDASALSYSPEEIQVIRNFPSFDKDKPQHKQLKELKEKYHKGQLTSEEKKLVKEIEVAAEEIHAMIKKKNLAKMLCEMKKYQ